MICSPLFPAAGVRAYLLVLAMLLPGFAMLAYALLTQRANEIVSLLTRSACTSGAGNAGRRPRR